ncbi:MAG: hypothetical protein AAF581_11135 [Planctomycetota bacterium]
MKNKNKGKASMELFVGTGEIPGHADKCYDGPLNGSHVFCDGEEFDYPDPDNENLTHHYNWSRCCYLHNGFSETAEWPSDGIHGARLDGFYGA